MDASRSLDTTNDAALRLLLLTGGPDAEAPISRAGAAEVGVALEDEPGIEIRTVDLPDGDSDAVRAAVQDEPTDVVFPLLHGPWGEGGSLQSILAGVGVPFVGCDEQAARVAMNKQTTKDRAAAAGVPIIPGGVVSHGQRSPVAPPAIVKPVDDGSSVGLLVAGDDDELREAIDAVTRTHVQALVERRIVGREITIGLLDGEPLPVVEIVSPGGVYDHDAKYASSETIYRTAPDDLPAGVVRAAEESAREVWTAIGARDLARVDFMIEDGVPYLLEANTMPGFTARSLFPRAAAAAGLPLGALAARLVRGAAARGSDGCIEGRRRTGASA